MRKPKLQTEQNLYPLWEIIDEASREALKSCYKKCCGLELTIPKANTADTIPIDWDKEVRRAPSRSRG